MQTERVTFLTTPDHKAALDAFAASSGRSVGHVVREATSRYIAQNDIADDELLELLVDELEAAIPHMQASLESMQQSISEARTAIQQALASADAAR